MDHICQTEKEAQHLSSKKHSPHLRHILARQSDQRRSPVSCWPSNHVHPAETTPLSSHGRQPHPKRHPPWRACYGTEASAARNLRFKDVCKRDMRALNINTESWEDLSADWSSWRNTFHKQLKLDEEKLIVMADEQWTHRKDPTTSDCNRDCHSLIGLFSHRQRCSSRADSLDGSSHGWPWLMGAY